MISLVWLWRHRALSIFLTFILSFATSLTWIFSRMFALVLCQWFPHDYTSFLAPNSWYKWLIDSSSAFLSSVYWYIANSVYIGTVLRLSALPFLSHWITSGRFHGTISTRVYRLSVCGIIRDSAPYIPVRTHFQQSFFPQRCLHNRWYCGPQSSYGALLQTAYKTWTPNSSTTIKVSELILDGPLSTL